LERIRTHWDSIIVQKTAQMTFVLLAGLFLATATTRVATSVVAPPGVLYVAPGANCGSGITVTNCYDNVQAAVDAAPPGAEIRIAAGAYTHTNNHGGLTQALYISKTLTVRGGYTITNWSASDPAHNPTVLNAQGKGRVIYVTGSITPTIKGLHITGGDADGLDQGTIPIDPGGGVYVDTAQATLSSNRIYSNTAEYGAGVYLLSGNATVSGNVVMSNTASLGGGGLYLEQSPARISGNVVVANASQHSGGGLVLYHHSDAVLTNNVIANNRAEASGSGVYILGSSPTLLHLTISNNDGGDRSGVYVTETKMAEATIYSTVMLTNTIVSDQGVGVYVQDGNTARLECTLWYNNLSNWSRSGDIEHSGDLTGDPAFVSPMRGDYHIGAASAARDAAVEAGVTTDVDGEPRPSFAGYDIGADELWLPALAVTQQASPEPVRSGARLTYTLCITNIGLVDLHATVTDTLPLGVLTDEGNAGTTVLPGGQLVWRPVVTAPGGVWTQQAAVTVALNFDEGTVKLAPFVALTNVVRVTTLEGASGIVTLTTVALPEHFIALPVVMRNYIPPENVLLNPGFEGIGVPTNNDAPNPDNWTRDTFDGVEYGEIFTPEGWVTWWEEGDHRRPEAKVIPREIPYTFDPIRIYRGYYAAMYFTLYGTHHAGYYQRVTGLPPGAPATFYAHAHGWSCHSDYPLGYSCGDPENLGFRVGIDPDGGVDPWSPYVIWSERTLSPDTFRLIGPVRATVGSEGNVTVFLRSDAQWPYKHNDAYWDNAALMVPIP
jgi:uncharacterized repeat protein (TIGR01451 family)